MNVFFIDTREAGRQPRERVTWSGMENSGINFERTTAPPLPFEVASSARGAGNRDCGFGQSVLPPIEPKPRIGVLS